MSEPQLIPASDPVQLVARLRAEGRLFREIAAEFGVSTNTVIRWLDPEYAQRCRDQSNAAKERRRRPCPECGTPMTSDGAGGHRVRLCQACDLIRRTAERVWTRDSIVDAIRRYASENGQPPAAHEWTLTNKEKHYPASSVVVRVFNRWSDAIEAAGFPRPPVGRRRTRPIPDRPPSIEGGSR